MAEKEMDENLDLVRLCVCCSEGRDLGSEFGAADARAARFFVPGQSRCMGHAAVLRPSICLVLQ